VERESIKGEKKKKAPLFDLRKRKKKKGRIYYTQSGRGGGKALEQRERERHVRRSAEKKLFQLSGHTKEEITERTLGAKEKKGLFYHQDRKESVQADKSVS